MYELTREIGNCAAVRLSGRLSLCDLRQMGADLERLVATHAAVRLMLRLEDFDGWGTGMVPRELRLDVRFGARVEVIAVVGQASWQRRMTDVLKTLTQAEVQYFEHVDDRLAWYWLVTS